MNLEIFTAKRIMAAGRLTRFYGEPKQLDQIIKLVDLL
jgi:hypothetical protein